MFAKSWIPALLGLLASAVFSSPAFAYDCDLVEVFNNKSGTLSFTGYEFIGDIDNSVALRTRLVLGGCQPGLLKMTVPAANRQLNNGDGTVTRELALPMLGGSVVTTERFKSRFDIRLPAQSYNAGRQSITLREVEFTPYWNDPTQTPGLLTFSVGSMDGGVTWALFAQMSYRANNGSVVSMNFPSYPLQVVGSGSAMQIGLQLNLESSFAPSTGYWTPKLKLIYLRNGVQFASYQHTLPTNMNLVAQRTGVIARDNLKTNMVVEFDNLGTCLALSPVECPLQL